MKRTKHNAKINKSLAKQRRLKAKHYPSWVAIIRTNSNKFRYTIRYTDALIKLKAAKTYPTHRQAYEAAVRAIKAHHEGVVNYII